MCQLSGLAKKYAAAYQRLIARQPQQLVREESTATSQRDQ